MVSNQVTKWDAAIAREIIRDVEEAIMLMFVSTRVYQYTGGWYYLDEWVPYMCAITDTLMEYVLRLHPNSAVPIVTDADLLAAASVVVEIKSAIHEKNAHLDRRLAQQHELMLLPSEPVDAELYRKIGDIIMLTRVCNAYDTQVDIQNSRRTIKRLLLTGRRRRLGTLAPKDVISLMPEVSSEHLKQIERYRELQAHLAEHAQRADGLPLPMIGYMPPEIEGDRKIGEIVVMSKYLLQHGYSRFWRQDLLKRLDELRPVIASGNGGMEFREAMEFLQKNYFRIRKAYEMHQERMERSESFLRAERLRFG